MDRRSFLDSLLGGAVAALTLDPESDDDYVARMQRSGTPIRGERLYLKRTVCQDATAGLMMIGNHIESSATPMVYIGAPEADNWGIYDNYFHPMGSSMGVSFRL